MTASLWTKNYILSLLANALSICAFDLLLPTLPVYLTINGRNSGEVGIIMGIFTFSAIIIRPFSAEGARQFGIKQCLYFGIVLSSLAIAAYSQGTTFTTAAGIRILHGLGFGISTTLTATIIAHVIPDSRRGEGVGYLGLGTVITASFAPFLGLWLLDNLGASYLFACSVFTQLCALSLISFISTAEFPVNTPPEKQASFINMFVEKSALFPSLLVMLLGICFSSILSFIALFGQERRIDNVGWFFIASTLGNFVARIVAGRIFDRKGHAWVIPPGSLLCLTGLILLSQATTVTHLMLAAAFYGLGGGTLFPSLQAWIINRTAPERRAEANAMFYNAFDVGIGFGSILLGFIAATASYSVMYLFAAGVMATLFTVYFVFQVLNNNNNSREEPA